MDSFRTHRARVVQPLQLNSYSLFYIYLYQFFFNRRTKNWRTRKNSQENQLRQCIRYQRLLIRLYQIFCCCCCWWCCRKKGELKSVVKMALGRRPNRAARHIGPDRFFLKCILKLCVHHCGNERVFSSFNGSTSLIDFRHFQTVVLSRLAADRLQRGVQCVD